MFKAREIVLGQLFDSGEYDQFIIPSYQRSYVWGQDELDNFWNDFVLHQSGQGKLHLMGSVIISKSKIGSKLFGVVDGQQRLITSCLFIAALRDVWGENFGYADEDYYNLERHVVKKDRSKGIILKVKVADGISEVMDSILVTKQLPVGVLKNADEKALVLAYKYFSSQIQKVIDKPGLTESNKKDLLWARIETLFSSNAILVVLDDEDDAHEVFEGFNARGVELSIADLFKNLIIQKIVGPPDLKNQALIKWNEINQIVKDVNVSKFNINTFLRYFWIRNHQYIGEKELYRRIKKDTKDYSQLLDELYSVAKNLQIVFSDNPWDIKEMIGGESKYSVRISGSIQALKVMNTQNYMVWLMTLFDNRFNGLISPKWLSLAMSQVEKFSFRYFSVSKLPSNRVEKLYAKLSKELFSILDEPAGRTLEGLVLNGFKNTVNAEKLLPTDEQFIEDFNNISLQSNNKSLIRYILTLIEESYGTAETRIDQHAVNIEHILPQRPGKDWNINSKDLKENVNRLGNLTILLEKINSSMGNRPMSDKAEMLSASILNLNKEIVEIVDRSHSMWGPAEIGDRHMSLAMRAQDVWKFE